MIPKIVIVIFPDNNIKTIRDKDTKTTSVTHAAIYQKTDIETIPKIDIVIHKKNIIVVIQIVGIEKSREIDHETFMITRERKTKKTKRKRISQQNVKRIVVIVVMTAGRRIGDIHVSQVGKNMIEDIKREKIQEVHPPDHNLQTEAPVHGFRRLTICNQASREKNQSHITEIMKVINQSLSAIVEKQRTFYQLRQLSYKKTIPRARI